MKGNLLCVLALFVLINTGCDRKTRVSSGTNPQTTEATETRTTEHEQRIKSEQTVQKDKEPYINQDANNEIKKIDIVLVEGGKMEIQGETVTLDSFYMNKYEMTLFLYEEIFAWALNKGYIRDEGYSEGDQKSRWESVIDTWATDKNIPIVVTWHYTYVICNYLSIMEGLTPVYYRENMIDPILNYDDIVTYAFDRGVATGTYKPFYIKWNADGYRLPTEAEWEYAARGGIRSQGYTYSGGNIFDEVAWPDIYYYIHPVGQKNPNELGMYDMTGNPSEWCFGLWEDRPSAKRNGIIHNPDRIDMVYLNDNSSFLRKGGRYTYKDSDGDTFLPQARILYRMGDEDGDRDFSYGTVRIVRSKNIP